METKPIPAPIDEKNVTTDWIEMLFDDLNCVCGGKHNDMYIGFRDDVPLLAKISGNTICWRFLTDLPDYNLNQLQFSLVDDLAALDADDENLISPCEIRDNGVVIQKFYFKNND